MNDLGLATSGHNIVGIIGTVGHEVTLNCLAFHKTCLCSHSNCIRADHDCHYASSTSSTLFCLYVQMSERTARAQLAEQQSHLAAAAADVEQLKASIQTKSDELLTQRAVNQQLMLKKEEVEWQLMAAIAKVGLSRREGIAAAAADQDSGLSAVDQDSLSKQSGR